jgi:SAM-dependent methyltransferase
MSGFSAEWLALREPADRRARSSTLVSELRSVFAGRDTAAVIDLGCGTGSNLRALAPSLPRRQSWRLVDRDRALLDAAHEQLAAWADASEAGAELHLWKGGVDIAVRFVEADLAPGVAPLLSDSGVDLVTAAALFDLVSASWIGSFARDVAAAGAAFYTALTYDGTDRWSPPHPADAAMLAGFHAHQRGDKGFGPAAGPRASELLEAALRAEGYDVRSAASPWRLGRGDAALMRELAHGTAAAVRETGTVAKSTIGDWLDGRLGAAACEIGHRDLLALPPR